MLRRNSPKRETLQKEEELLVFARSYLSDAFPNPERTGCPPDDALKAMALGQSAGNESVSEHLTCCSPCFKAYIGYLAQKRVGVRRLTWVKRSAVALGIAAILVAVAYLLVTKRRSAPIVAPGHPAPITEPKTPNQTQTAVYVPVLIDLSGASPTRGSKQRATRPVPQIIPSGSPVSLTLRLPLGSEERSYLITLTSGREVVWSASAQARRENGDTLLHVNGDFKAISTGGYRLQISSGGRRLSTPILIKTSLTTTEQQH
jgi:hypothetical protein